MGGGQLAAALGIDAEAPKPKPTVGRIVHWTTDEGECLAAIITAVPEPAHVEGLINPVSLTVFDTDGVFFPQGVEHDPYHEADSVRPQHWHWPERA